MRYLIAVAEVVGIVGYSTVITTPATRTLNRIVIAAILLPTLYFMVLRNNAGQRKNEKE